MNEWKERALSGYHTPSSYIFGFAADGQVNSMSKIDSRGRVKAERIDRDETFTVLDGYVIKEETERYGQVEWTIYADSDGNGRYAEVLEGTGDVDYSSLLTGLDQLGTSLESLGITFEVGRENHVFTFDGAGNVTAVGEVDRRGAVKSERIDANETYTQVGDFVIQVETSRNGQQEWTVYAGGDGDNRWAEIAEGHGVVSLDAIAQVIPQTFATFG